MIEVLVTIVILTLGLLGMVGLQARMQSSEMESYQRAQALVLLNDMSNRITTNRNGAAAYTLAAVGADPVAVGAGAACPTDVATIQERDTREWCLTLQGAAAIYTDTSNFKTQLGAMIGGRGCVENLSNGQYLVTVAWQGQIPLSAPPVSVACGKDLYNGPTGSACVADLCRRVVTAVVRIAPLIN
jgi:type IV pilus assembly protein PilV